MFDVIVIGGGPAGVTAALRARELGASVALVERERMGGTCTNDGCAPTRVLAKAARLMREAQHFEEYGLMAAQPAMDFGQLVSRTQQTIYRLHEKKQLIDHLTRAGASVFTNAGDAKFVDAHTIELENGTRLNSDTIILCVGGHARRFTFPGSEHAITHHDVWALKQTPRSMAIVGGAATGCQVASIFSAFGSDVTLFEVHQHIVGREDSVISQAMTEAFMRRGIDVVTGIGGVERIEKLDNGMLQLWYTKDEQSCVVTAESVLLSVGWVGNIEHLNLDAAGVQTERGYVVVNDYFQTTVPHIFAAGDITGRMMLVQSGSYEGRMAAENAILGAEQPYKHQIVPHGGFTDPEYASVGLTEEQARAQGDIVVAVVPYADLDRAVIDDHTEGYCKLVVSQETHRILGAHIVGEQALEIVQLVAAGMAADMWVEQLAELEIAYPTYTAIVGLAARHIVRELGVMPLSSEWRTLGRTHAAEWERSSVA